MEFWKGGMDWDLKHGWKCEVCGKYEGLTWGLAHGTCRCNVCHTEYRMRDKKGEVVDTPICQLKPEFFEPAKIGFAKYNKPIEEFSNEEWKESRVVLNPVA